MVIRVLVFLILCLVSAQAGFSELGKTCGKTSPVNHTCPHPCKNKDASIGVFIDSPVSGLSYTSATFSGTTDTGGRFTYSKDDEISFSIGGLFLGVSSGKEIVTPRDLVSDAADASDQRVINRLVLLQTLDQDGDLNNGIRISPDTCAIVSDYSEQIDFDMAPANFAASSAIIDLLAELNDAGVFTDTDPRERTIRPSLAALEHFTRSTSERKIVRIHEGLVRGYAATDETWQFLGIPYAQPPLGDLRWRPPQPIKKWKGVRDAIAWSDQAAQNPGLQKYGEGGMSEDCLYLNVSTPKDAKKLPVMVWFHGGGFTALTSNTKAFNNPESLTTKGVVLVTVNHRLGPFGYMAHPLLTEESGIGSGNYGQMDLISALTWVKKNIRSFGGNPHNVTIFGESGGGRKVLSLMASPMAKGLFHKAISQSGTLYPDTRSQVAAEAHGLALSEALGTGTLEELRAIPWPEIVTAATNTMVPYTNVDGIYLPVSERESYETGLNNDVPFMISINTNDTPDPIGTINNVLPWMSDHKKENIYACLFSQVPSDWNAQGVLAYHSCELTYVFNYPESVILHYLLGLVVDPSTGSKLVVGDMNGNGITWYLGDSEDIFLSAGFNEVDAAVADTTMTLWTNFAKTGVPYTEEILWPAYTSENDTYLNLGEVPLIETGLSKVFP